MSTALLWLLPVVVMGAGNPLKPTGAIMPLAALNGVSPDAAALVTENAVDELRRANVFYRVTSWPEMQAMLSMEQSRQLANCDEASCVAEIMGNLNVDYGITGSVGKLGRNWIVNMLLLNVKTSTTVASVSLPICGGEEALVGAVRPAVTSLLFSGHLTKRTPEPVPEELLDCRDPTLVAAEREKQLEADKPHPVRAQLKVTTGIGGAVAAGLGVVAVLASTVGALLTGLYVSRLLSPDGLRQISTGPLKNEQRLAVLWFPAMGSALLVAVVGVAGLLSLGVGATAVILVLLLGVL